MEAFAARRAGKKSRHARRHGLPEPIQPSEAEGAPFPLPLAQAQASQRRPPEDEDIFAGVGAYNPDGQEGDGHGGGGGGEPPRKKRSRWDAPAAAPAAANLSACSPSLGTLLQQASRAPTLDVFGGLRAPTAAEEAAADEAAAAGGERRLGDILSGIKGLAKAADRIEARKVGKPAPRAAATTTAGSDGPAGEGRDLAGGAGVGEAAKGGKGGQARQAGLGLGGTGEGYGEEYDVDFTGE